MYKPRAKLRIEVAIVQVSHQVNDNDRQLLFGHVIEIQLTFSANGNPEVDVVISDAIGIEARLESVLEGDVSVRADKLLNGLNKFFVHTYTIANPVPN